MSTCTAAAKNEITIWPKGVGYDTQSGYHSESYDSKTDQIQRVEQLVEAWKAAAKKHRFSSENVSNLFCFPYDGCHQLLFINSKQELATYKCQILTVDAEADVDEVPSDTSMGISISGKNYDTGKDFTFSLNVYRFPQVNISTKYEEKTSLNE